jgi:hypothetical protein
MFFFYYFLDFFSFFAASDLLRKIYPSDFASLRFLLKQDAPKCFFNCVEKKYFKFFSSHLLPLFKFKLKTVPFLTTQRKIENIFFLISFYFGTPCKAKSKFYSANVSDGKKAAKERKKNFKKNLIKS